MNLVSLDQLSYETFAGLAGAGLRVGHGSGDSVELRLCEATTPKYTVSGGLKHEHFTLVFRGAADRLLPQKTYWFEAAGIGRFELFIVPVSRDGTDIRYEATFNRLMESR